MPEWKRKSSQIFNDDILESWEYEDSQVMYLVGKRFFYCTWGEMRQVSIMKRSALENNLTSVQEPNMSEKNFVLKGINALSERDEVALEVFPKKSNIVDQLDLYHLWIISKAEFPCYIEIKMPNFAWIFKKRIKINGKNLIYQRRKIRKNGQIIEIYYVKAEDTSELMWYEKQNFKDFVIGKDVIAVEYSAELTENIAVLVCIPKSIGNLPFGLKKSQST